MISRLVAALALAAAVTASAAGPAARAALAASAALGTRTGAATGTAEQALSDAVDDFVARAAGCLAASQVCPLDGTVLEVDQAVLADALPNGIALAVVPESRLETAVATMSAGQLASRLATGAGSAVLVVVDKANGRDSFGLAGGDLTDDQISDVLTVLNQSQAASGEQAITASAAELADIFAPGAAETPAAAHSDSDSPVKSFLRFTGVVLAIIVGGVILLVAGLVLIVVLILRRSSPKRRGRHPVDKKLFDKSTHADAVERWLLKLRELADLYAAKPSRYKALGRPIHLQINSVIGDVQELFRRLRARGSAQQTRLAEAKYSDVLKKLVLAVDRDYYQDIIDNPRLWSGAPGRVDAIGRALAAVHEQVLENIKQVNASKDLEFQVALDSLLESQRAAKLSDVYGDGPDGPDVGRSADHDPNQPERQ
jgi:hypothetical protein